MPGERRNLRSNKESTSSTNGEKARSDSQNSTSNKDKPVPARTSSKGKAIPTKKSGTNIVSKAMNAEKSKTNGTDTTENGVNGTEDIEMADETTDEHKASNGKDGEDEMTVVVPPPKSSKLAGEPSKDSEGDVAMETAQKPDASRLPTEEVDPTIKAVSGKLMKPSSRMGANVQL